MFHDHSSGTSNMKNIKGNRYLNKASVGSKYRVELEIIKSNDDIIN